MYTKIIKTYCLIAILGCLSVQASAAAKKPSKKSKQKTESVADSPKSSEYQKLLKNSKSVSGLMTVHITDDGKCMLEIPASLLGQTMMISSKVSESSNSVVAMAGTMIAEPKLIMFTVDKQSIILRHIVSDTPTVDDQNEINKSVQRNNIVPAAELFKIVCKSDGDSSYVFDVTNFMISTADGMGIESDMMAVMMGAPRLSSVQSLCSVVGAKAFEHNINIRVRLCYKGSDNSPFETTVTRSIILLSQTPMKGRQLDPRMNYFSTDKNLYLDNKDKSSKLSYIHRWNLNPKKEDIERYKRGELVEPEKQIVYYVDNAFPDKWRKYIKLGIEDWQKGFEAIGFKNAIVAKDFPENDPDFDPEDIRYSCFRYITSQISNAMGPSWVDPRSGEIIQGSVYFYHNVLQIIHNWMFTQTAAANPLARDRVFDEQTMGRAIRYIAAHEIGHTLGLMHNMKASSAYPVDSLRSATFTQKYGTTASIMDYARFNYVAQPEDKGVSFFPPLLGEYDKFSIKIGYMPIFKDDETETIKQWFEDVKSNKRLLYGEQAMGMPLDPSAQTEDLGDDPVKASYYGIKNCKYILSHLLEWAIEKQYDIEQLKELYEQMQQQYSNYIGHVMTVVGGTYLHHPELKDGSVAYVPVSKAKQKEAVQFLLNEIAELPKWSNDREIIAKFKPGQDNVPELQVKMMQELMSLANRVESSNYLEKDGYSGTQFIEDIYQYVWSSDREQTKYQHNLEYNYVKTVMNQFGMTSTVAGGGAKNTVQASGILSGKESSNRIIFKQTYFSQLNKIKQLAKKRMVSSNVEVANHYKYLYYEIDKALGNN